MTQSRALFLDRDGVINHDSGYTHTVAAFQFIDGIFDVARLARSLDFALVVVTNQAGIGRGLYTEDDFHALTAWMKDRFTAEGAALTGVYFCPDHPEGKPPYNRVSDMRKPGPGMLLAAARDHDLDLGTSIMVGDKEIDMLAGRRAGVATTVLFGPAEVPQGSAADLAVPSHAALAAWLQTQR
jgi:D-glycero-D-manno-heptose 1,7-bisphosphate phosphatase